MRLSLATALLLASFASAAPQPLTVKVTTIIEEYTQQANDFISHYAPDPFQRIASALTSGAKGRVGANDICPDLKVSCLDKEGTTVGDIGKKPFCWNRDDDSSLLLSFQSHPNSDSANSKAVGCSMCEPTKNDAECNLRFPDKCVAQCRASGPLGGH